MHISCVLCSMYSVLYTMYYVICSKMYCVLYTAVYSLVLYPVSSTTMWLLCVLLLSLPRTVYSAPLHSLQLINITALPPTPALLLLLLHQKLNHNRFPTSSPHLPRKPSSAPVIRFCVYLESLTDRSSQLISQPASPPRYPRREGRSHKSIASETRGTSSQLVCRRTLGLLALIDLLHFIASQREQSTAQHSTA